MFPIIVFNKNYLEGLISSIQCNRDLFILIKVMAAKIQCAQSRLTLCNPMGCNPPGSSVHRIFQARILEWIVISSSRGSSWPRSRAQVSCSAGRFLTNWVMREAPDVKNCQNSRVKKMKLPKGQNTRSDILLKKIWVDDK